MTGFSECGLLRMLVDFILCLNFYRQLQKAKLKHSNAVVIRDSLRNEVSKQQISAEELKEQMEQQVLI